jgi:hypothetical protein
VCLVGLLGAFGFAKSQKPIKWSVFVPGIFIKAVFS